MRAGQIALITAGAAVTGVLGYALYFDYMRRNSPEFRKGLSECEGGGVGGWSRRAIGEHVRLALRYVCSLGRAISGLVYSSKMEGPAQLVSGHS